MATIKGKWVWSNSIPSSRITSDIAAAVNFASNNEQFTSIEFKTGTRGKIWYDTFTVFTFDGGDTYGFTPSIEAYKTMDFGDTEQTIDDVAYNMITANATPEAEPIPTDKVSVLYKGELLGTIEQGNEGVVACNGKTMEDDITITVPMMVSATAKAILFSIAGTYYVGIEGMTWGDWCSSEYNTGGFTISDTYVIASNGYYIWGSSHSGGFIRITNVDVVSNGSSFVISQYDPQQ